MLPVEKQIKTKADLRRFLDTEIKRYGKKGKLLLPFSEKDILVKHNILLRKSEYHKNTKHKLRYVFYYIRLRSLQNKHAMHIPLNCCDEGLKIMHVGPVAMNDNACVGKNFSMHLYTAIAPGGVHDKCPVIGDGVVVGIGAVVLGDITIANNVAVGANALVNKDVLEENVAVAGVPAKIISRNGSLSWNKK